VFTTSRKAAQQTARRLISGHVSLIAWWTLRHAGVFDAILKQEAEDGEGLNPLVFATRTNMSYEVLAAMIDYLVSAGLMTLKGDQVRLTPEGRALLEGEDGVLELLRAYQPVLNMSEHLLAKLKSYGPAANGGGAAGGGVTRKNENLLESQSKRYAAEVFPAVEDLVARHRCSHLLDVACGTGDLLIYLAQQLKKIVGVGIGADPLMVRRANSVITAADLETRLIAVAAAPLDVCTDTPRAFDRIGLSRQLWNELDLLILSSVLSDLAAASTDPVTVMTKALVGLRKNFPKASLLVMEPVDSPRFEKNYYAPEMALLLKLTRAHPWPAEKWRDLFTSTGYTVADEVPLTTDGLDLFVLKPA
jgi:predicted transcriptional regulator/SAM-dependent methyltransferase